MNAIIKDLKIVPRYDLQTPFVHISYEQTTTINGQSWMAPAEDIFPNPPPSAALAQFNALRATVDLQGLSANTTTANLVCDPIIADPAASGATQWWLNRHPQYKPFDPTIPPDASGPPSDPPDPNNPITAFELIPGTLYLTATNPGEALLNLPNELRTGQIAPWMNFNKQRITITVKANITHRNGNVVANHPLTYQCMATNATSGAYANSTITQYPEPVPTGLAEFLYDAAGVLQYDGQLTLQEEEVSGQLAPGDLFNLTGGNLAEWATMNAMVQTITESLDDGTTLVEFGPPKHLGAGELVDLLRVNRSRTFFYWPTLQTSGLGGGGAESVSLGDDTPEKNSASTPGFTQSHVVSNFVDGSGPNVVSQIGSYGLFGSLVAFSFWTPNGPFVASNGVPPPTPGSISINTNDIAADAGNGVFVQLRKIPICLNGQSGQMYFLCSQFIPD
jgi:hypothetical protein